MRRACSDEMVEKFVIVGSPDEVRRRVDRIAEVADLLRAGAPRTTRLSSEKIARLQPGDRPGVLPERVARLELQLPLRSALALAWLVGSLAPPRCGFATPPPSRTAT